MPMENAKSRDGRNRNAEMLDALAANGRFKRNCEKHAANGCFKRRL